jgi:hypothetical protein
MTSPFHEVIRFPRKLKPFPVFSDAPFNPMNAALYETINMKFQYWAINGIVKGIPVTYVDPNDGFMVIKGFRCERCNKVFFAAEINDFAHECMDAA